MSSSLPAGYAANAEDFKVEGKVESIDERGFAVVTFATQVARTREQVAGQLPGREVVGRTVVAQLSRRQKDDGAQLVAGVPCAVLVPLVPSKRACVIVWVPR